MSRQIPHAQLPRSGTEGYPSFTPVRCGFMGCSRSGGGPGSGGWNPTERKPGKETEKNRLDRDAWEGGGCVVAVDWEIRSGYQRPASAWMKQETIGHRYASVNFRQGCVLCMWAGLTAKTGRALKLHGESKSRRREATHRA